MLRLVTAVVLFTLCGQPLLAQEVEDDGSYRMFLSAGAGRFIGDYGRSETAIIDVLSLNGRLYFKRAELQVSVPYLKLDGVGIRFVDGQPVVTPDDPMPDSAGNASGFGDIVVRGEYYLRAGTSTTPWVIGRLRVKLPTGDDDKGLGTGSTDVEFGGGLIQQYRGLNLLADIGYTVAGDAFGLDSKNLLRLGAGVAMPFGADDRHNTYLYFENRTNRFSGSDDRRSLAAGVGTALDKAKRLRLSASLFFGFSDASEDVGFYLTFGRRY